jgi:predicted ArsR family transcriptional regulator
MTTDELSNTLNITRNAVTQHLLTLEGLGFIQSSTQSSTGGRPSKLYTLTLSGKELFPKHYDLFATLLIQLINEKSGSGALSQYMKELGETVALQYQPRITQNADLTHRTNDLVGVMQELGYKARIENKTENSAEIIADNCVFHKLALNSNAVCDVDTSLITSLLKNTSVEHSECIVRGGQCCRFLVSEK